MKKIQQYLNDVVGELKKVTWPANEELKGSTVVVLAFTVAMSTFVLAADWIVLKGLDLVQSLF
jgi:preprotein translocase subunit SecE